MLGSQYCSSGIYQIDSPSKQNYATRGVKDQSISRRLADPGQVLGGDGESKNIHPETSDRTRHFSKRRKVHFGSDIVHILPRNAERFVEFWGFPEPEMMAKSVTNVQSRLALRLLVCKILAEDVRTHSRPGEVGTGGEASHGTLSMLHQKGLVRRIAPDGPLNTVSADLKRDIAW